MGTPVPHFGWRRSCQAASQGWRSEPQLPSDWLSASPRSAAPLRNRQSSDPRPSRRMASRAVPAPGPRRQSSGLVIISNSGDFFWILRASGSGDRRMLDDTDIVRLLRSEVDRAGGQSAWARRERIDRTLLNRILCGQKPPTDKIIRALKLCNDYALHNDGAPESGRRRRAENLLDPDPTAHRSGQTPRRCSTRFPLPR
jgi:hypothetical protein